MNLNLEGKVAIITGGGEGIGYATTFRIAKEGGSILIVGRREELLNKAAATINAHCDGIVKPYRADITAEGAAQKIVDAALNAFGRVDILVNNAGVSSAKPFEQVTRSEWSDDFDLKLWAAIELIREVIPIMRHNKAGRIINVTNLDGRTPGAGKMPTSISRAAGIALTKGLSKDLAVDNILVNTVCIGFVKSGQHERRFKASRESKFSEGLDDFYSAEAKRRAVPLGRVGEGSEAGDIIAFLASGCASYITGVAINIDGGLSTVV